MKKIKILLVFKNYCLRKCLERKFNSGVKACFIGLSVSKLFAYIDIQIFREIKL